MTEQERENYNKKTARKKGIIIRFMRICKYNKDIMLLLVLTISLFVAGYFLAKMIFNFSSQEIYLGFYDFLKFIFASITAIVTFVFKLTAKQGTISKQFSSTKVAENVAKNADFMLAITVGITFLAIGYFFARFYFHLNVSELKAVVVEFFEFLFVFFIAMSAFLSKLGIKQGDLAETLASEMNKDIDSYGNSINREI